jgi:hypothetical protein
VKKILTAILFFIAFSSSAQDKIKINRIDSIVKSINSSHLPVQRDTLNQDQPALGLESKTYLAATYHSEVLIKYEQHANMKMANNGVSKQMKSTIVFYFHTDKLIKAEVEFSEKKATEWYYENDEPLLDSSAPEIIQEQALFVLNTSKNIAAQFKKQQ